MLFTFKHALESQRDLIHSWLAQDYIAAWIHGQGLQSTLDGLERFFKGEQDPIRWIAYDDQTPFAFLITSQKGVDAITLDVFIVDKRYLGKGLATPMIKTFLKTHFADKKKVFIDPEATNERAIHVYKKIGFKKIDEFIASWHPVPHILMELDMKLLD